MNLPIMKYRKVWKKIQVFITKGTWQVLVLEIWETLKTTESFEALAPEIQEVLKTTESGRRLRRNIRK